MTANNIKRNNVKIHIKDLRKKFGKNEVLKGISTDIYEGEVVCVIGPSGSGKSTFLRCMNKWEDITSGEVIVDGFPINDKRININKVRERMGMVFQCFNLFPHMTVMDNLISAPVMVKKMDKNAAVERAKELLHDVGLLDKQSVYPSALSGGQKQRVAIARALMMDPDILLFDEPTSSLDPQLTAEVLAVMKKLVAKRMTMIVVTHEMGFAREAADKVMFMGDKRIIEMGPTEQIFEHPSDPRIKEFIQSIL